MGTEMTPLKVAAAGHLSWGDLYHTYLPHYLHLLFNIYAVNEIL